MRRKKVIEADLELSDEAKKDIEQSLREYQRGEFSTLEEVKKDLGIRRF